MPQRSPIPTKPNPGYYLVRLAAKAWEVPACIIRPHGDAYEVWIDGVQVGIFTSEDFSEMILGFLFAEKPSPVTSLLLRGKPTDEATYRYRLATKEWAAENAPHHPCLHPMKAIDFRLLRPEDL